jgi:SAM-dependent methyltransferase
VVYSCGYFTDIANSIDQAQKDKLDHICRKLRLKPGERLLDIGCGWGAMLIHAAKYYGVVGHVSLSEAQTQLARERIRAEGLEDRITIEIKSYAELSGSFDKISSIGMFEHLGLANHAAYFSAIHRLFDHVRTRLGTDIPDRRHQACAWAKRPATDAGGPLPVVGSGRELISATAQRPVFDALVAARIAAKSAGVILERMSPAASLAFEDIELPIGPLLFEQHLGRRQPTAATGQKRAAGLRARHGDASVTATLATSGALI